MLKQLSKLNPLSKIEPPESFAGILALGLAFDVAIAATLGQALWGMPRHRLGADLSWMFIALFILSFWTFMKTVPHQVAVILKTFLPVIPPFRPCPGRLIGGAGFVSCAGFRSEFITDGNSVAKEYYDSVLEQDARDRKSIRFRLAFLILFAVSLKVPTEGLTFIQSGYLLLSSLPRQAAEWSLLIVGVLLVGVFASVIFDIRAGEYDYRYHIYIGEKSDTE